MRYQPSLLSNLETELDWPERSHSTFDAVIAPELNLSGDGLDDREAMLSWADEEAELESFFGSVFDQLKSTFNRGKEVWMVRKAIQSGERDKNQLTNKVFFARHPERQGRKLRSSEPNFQQLRREWLEIRDQIVVPTLNAATTTPTTPSSSGLGSRVEDRTAFSLKSRRKGQRPVSQVYALVLHQMAFSRGNDPRKYDRVNSHFIILPNGRIIQLHPISAYLWASNGFNRRSVAVEFAGNFPSVRGRCYKPEKFGCHRVTTEQIQAGRYLIRYLQKKIGLTHVLTHRQSSAQRQNDPGPDLWYHVGQWAIDHLGMHDGGPGFKIGSGNPIPDSWRTWGRR